MQPVTNVSLVNVSVQTESGPLTNALGFSRIIHEIKLLKSDVSQWSGRNDGKPAQRQPHTHNEWNQPGSESLVNEIRSIKTFLRESQLKIDVGYEHTLETLGKLQKQLDSGIRDCKVPKAQNDRLVKMTGEKSTDFNNQLTRQCEGIQHKKREDIKKISNLITTLSSQKFEISTYHATIDSYKAKVTEKDGRINYLENKWIEAESNLATVLRESSDRERELDNREAILQLNQDQLNAERAEIEKCKISLKTKIQKANAKLKEGWIQVKAQMRRIEGDNEKGCSLVTFEGTCLTCTENHYLEVFLPCMHTLVCSACATRLLTNPDGKAANQCPECRQEVLFRKKGIYRHLDLDQG